MSRLSIFSPARRRLLPPPLLPTASPTQPLPPTELQTQFFSTTPSNHAPKNRRPQQRDSRIKLIRYHLFHPRNPRPLRLSRSRHLRHWTIHRAWQLFRRNQDVEQQKTLQKQYHAMRDACEALRLLGEDGLAVHDAPTALSVDGTAVKGRTVPPPGARDPAVRTFVRGGDGALVAGDMVGEGDRGGERVEVDVRRAAEGQREVGRLYRIAMEKKGVFGGVPIEYARIQTDTPPRDGWDHGWTRQ